MGLFDSIQSSAKDAFSALGSNVEAYIKTNVTQALVKVGEPPKGNLTPAQIAAGQTGQPPPMATPASMVQSAAMNVMPYLPILLGVAALAYVMKKRR